VPKYLRVTKLAGKCNRCGEGEVELEVKETKPFIEAPPPSLIGSAFLAVAVFALLAGVFVGLVKLVSPLF